MIPEKVLEIIRGRDSSTVIAVVGATTNPAKTGNAIVKRLHGAGFTVRPVNPGSPEVEGLKAYKNLELVPDPVHIVNFVTPPKVTEKIVAQMDPERFSTVWFQVGSVEDDCLVLAESKFEIVIADNCIMVAVSLNPPV